MTYKTTMLGLSPELYYTKDDSAGTTAVDDGALSQDGTYTNAPTLSANPLILSGTSADYNGSNQYMAPPNGALSALASTGACTWVFWIKPDSVTTSTTLVDFTFNGSNSMFYINVDGSGNLAIGGRTNSAEAYKSATFNGIITTDAQMIVAVYDAANDLVKCYRNGVLQGSTSTSWDNATFNYSQATDAAYVARENAGNYFDGRIDELAFFDSELSAGTIGLLYAEGVSEYAGSVNADAPELYYRHESTSGTTLVDSGAQAQNLTFNGGITTATGLVNDGNAIDYDGSADYASGSNALSGITDTGQLTIEFWLNADDVSTTQYLYEFQDSGAGTAITAYITTGGTLNAFSRTASEGFSPVNWAGVLTVDTTHHIVIVYDAANDRVGLYVDNVFQSWKALAHTLTFFDMSTITGNVGVGSLSAGAGKFNGTLDELAMYGSELASNRVEAHYFAGLGTTPTRRLNWFDTEVGVFQALAYSDSIYAPQKIIFEGVGGTTAIVTTDTDQFQFKNASDIAIGLISTERSYLSQPTGSSIEVQDDDYGGAGLGGDVKITASGSGIVDVTGDIESSGDITPAGAVVLGEYEFFGNTAQAVMRHLSSDDDRILIGGGSGISTTNGAYIIIEGVDYGGTGLGGNFELRAGSGGIVNIIGSTAFSNGTVKLPSYTVSGIPTGSAGECAYVTDGDAGSPCLAVHDGTSWKRISLGATISAT